MENIIAILIIVSIAVFIIWYLIYQKQKGVKCVGCPYAKKCNKAKSECKGK